MEVNRPDILVEVEALFRRYEAALVANDVAVLDELFWDSPSTVRFGVAENLYGHAAIAAFRAGRPVGDLARELTRVVTVTFGGDVAVVSAEFRRTASGTTGRQQQTWVRTDGGWRIVAAHVS
jgi:ketosteroid isomerase-like protein